MKRTFICIVAIAFIVGGFLYTGLTGLNAGSGAQSAPAGSVSSEAVSSEPAASSGAASAPQAETPASSAPTESAASSEAGRAQKTILTFTLEGDTEQVPATLYVGEGYSLYVPDEGWTVSTSDGTTTWLSTDNEAVGLSVQTLTGTTGAAARSAYIEASGFTFEDQSGGELGDPLTGWDEDSDALAIMSAEKDGTVYLLAWTYPEEAVEGFGARLPQIADTFELM